MAGTDKESQTFMRQNVTSLWQSDVQMILILTSCALGGSTTISSMASGSPAALHTAAARRRKGKPVSRWDGRKTRQQNRN
jgi:hypothetical protein